MGNPFENKESHESYGMLQFCKTSHGSYSIPLFGSSIKHSDTICMYLRTGEISRKLNRDYYFGDETIVECEMSQTQFAEAITTMNIGTGVPVTIRQIQGKRIDECPFTDKREQFQKEFSSHLDKENAQVNSLINELTDMFDKDYIGKKDRAEIIKKLNHIKMEIGINREFIYKQFNEQMDKTTLEAKGEIEAFMQNKLTSIAKASISEQREDILKLDNPVSID